MSSRLGGYENRLPAVRALVALVQVVAEAAGEHLLHRREVVLAVEGLDLEAAVVGALRQAVLHHHHRRDDLGALQVRDVEALDAQRRLGQLERLLQRDAARGRARCDRTPRRSLWRANASFAF